jgi:hypothetical protein
MSSGNTGFLRILAQVLIGLFVFWHAAAICVYAIPTGTDNAVAKPLRSFLVREAFAPYILSLSQWQQWNLFSPDPLRRVTRYRIERQLPDESWEQLELLGSETYPWWRHSTNVKMHIGMLETDQDTYNVAVVRHFLHQRCAQHHLPSETAVRIAYVYYIVSRPASWRAAFHPDPWPPEVFTVLSDPEYCP